MMQETALDEETATSNNIDAQTNEVDGSTSHHISTFKKPQIIYFVLSLACLVWAVVVTVLYAHKTTALSSCISSNEADTQIRSYGTLGVAAISHINVVVNDSIDVGAEYYQEVLGFVPASNADGPMKYTNITNHGFCVDAGFESCRVDIIFLKHEIMNLYLELFFYYEPTNGSLEIPMFQTNDAGGIRHIAVEVEDAVKTYDELRSSNHQGRFITKDTPIPLDPFPYTFFYWVDKYGVQWEFEQGRPVQYYEIAGITG